MKTIEKVDEYTFIGDDGETFTDPGEYEFEDEVAERYLEWGSWEKPGDDSGSTVREDPMNIEKRDPTAEGVNAPEGEGRAPDVSMDELESDVVETMEVSTVEEDDGDTGEPEPDSVDLSEFLTANVGPIEEEISEGQFDDDLDTLMSIESSTRDRKTVKEAIEDRKAELQE